MHHIGDINVLRQLRSSSKRPWKVVCGGTMRGTYGGGQVTAIQERKLTSGIAGIVCDSAGTATASYSVADQAALGTSIYYEECTTKKFISVSRYMRGGNGVDIGYLGDVFSSGPKRLDQERIYASQTELWFGVTEFPSGCGRYLDAKKIYPDIVHGIKASAAIPGLYRDEVYINGVRYVDGGISCRPIQEVLQKKPDGIIVLANCDGHRRMSATKKHMERVLLRKLPEPIRHAMEHRYDADAEDMACLRDSGVPYLVIYSDNTVGSYTRKPAVLQEAAEKARLHMHHLFDRAGL